MTDHKPAGDTTPHSHVQHASQRLASREPQHGSPSPAEGGSAAERKRPPRRGPSAGRKPSARPKPRVQIDSVAGILAVVPYLLGFHPSNSLVVIGIGPPRGQIKLAFRYDLPDPPDAVQARDIAAHAVAVLNRQQIDQVIVIGYGPGTQVTPVAELLRARIDRARIELRDLVRVEDSRYWSYLCDGTDCCPAEGVPFDAVGHPAAAALTTAGLPAYPDRAALSRSLAPLTGVAAESMKLATERAMRRGEQLVTAALLPATGDVTGPSAGPSAAGPAASAPPAPGPRASAAGASRRAAPGRAAMDRAMRLFAEAGRQAARDAIDMYRAGGQITDDDQIAWLSVALTDLRVRDDAWARMNPEHRDAHLRLWTDVVRRACPAYVPAPAALLAFTAWQSGDGALANIAIERALDADPGYSMALLLAEAIESGLPPSAARLPMTPDEVAASYDGAGPGRAAGRRQRRADPRSL